VFYFESSKINEMISLFFFFLLGRDEQQEEFEHVAKVQSVIELHLECIHSNESMVNVDDDELFHHRFHQVNYLIIHLVIHDRD